MRVAEGVDPPTSFAPHQPMKKPDYACLHHSGVSHEKNKDQFKANNAYHRAKWNFKSSLGYYLGYNYEISAKGKVRQARADGETTAAVWQEGMNDGRCVHICLDGNFDIEKPTAQQIYALRDLLKRLKTEHGIKSTNFKYHSDFANKTCPGKNLQEDRDFITRLAWERESTPEPNLKKQIYDHLNELTKLIHKIDL